ncbi:unnamed protein product [Adineta steineri]|uniref:Ankyrin repeat protein n=1 Tax=Adineta steineri TaxID=433720 RepID=A0A818S7M5_9BILA|nr:unnamed protein product [Adineta steineri]
MVKLLSRSSTSTNIYASGDEYSKSIKSKKNCRWFIKRRRNEIENYSSDSLKVNINDLADIEELKKISIHPQLTDSSSSSINHLHILNEFRMNSKEILRILSQKNIEPYLSQYYEQDTGRKLLSIAAETGWYEGVLFLLNRDVNINETDRENRTALMDCLTSTNIHIMNALVKKRECNLDIQTLTGHTAAHYAVMMNKISFFEILIKSGARLDLCNDKGENVLHQIIEYKRKECWKIVKDYSYDLIYHKYLINSKTYEHKTCLTLAFEHRPNIYFFRELLSYSDDITLMDIEMYQSWSKAYKLMKKFISL